MARLTPPLGYWAPGRVWLALGTNLPPQAWRWQRMIVQLGNLPGFRLEAISQPWRNPALGAKVRGQFLNGVAVGYSRVGPLELLRRLKLLERRLGRCGGGDRPADFDILCWQDGLGWRNLQLNHLRIPHQRAKYRDFVLAPLADLPEAPPLPLRLALEQRQRRLEPKTQST